MTDLVYILGSGSPLQNTELRYSLASVEKNMLGVRDVYIIGDHPGFEGNFIHIPDTDRGKNKQDNIRLKIQTACEHPDISDPFLFMNDDFIITKPVHAGSMPYYYNTNLTRMWKAKRKVGHYKTALLNTLIALSEKDLPLKHYDIHTPILYGKKEFLEVMSRYNWNQMHGYVIKSLYCNSINIEPEFHIDPKVTPAHEDFSSIENDTKEWFMFSFDDNSFNQTMLKYIENLYRKVSPRA
jgi:hypothetical protein